MISIIHKADCCGCGACQQRCPKQCISMQEDQEGFLYPIVDEEDCTNCGACEKVCPLLGTVAKSDIIEVLAAKNSHEDERMLSSSGGVFFPLAKTVISRGGVVFGALFDEDWMVVITYAETLEGVKPMVGSKYLQASAGTSYQDAERFLKQGREVLFCGSPCQIAGLKKYLRKDYPNLLAVDFLCHGVPSPGVWRRYIYEDVLKESARRVAAGKNTVLSSSLNSMPVITGIEFRDKTFYGWKKYSFVVRQRSVLQADKNTVLLSDIHRNNPFMRGFLHNIYLRPSCYECRCKNGVSNSDLTIGDFWGIDTLVPDFDDDKGVGLVVISSIKGKSAFNALDMDTLPFSMGVVFPLNGGFMEKMPVHPNRIDFFIAYAKGESVSVTVERLLRIPFYRRIFGFIKRCIRKIMPNVIVRLVKKQLLKCNCL